MVGRKGGWTLIEVLVVLAIILVLAALMYAIGGVAVDRAHQARCTSNLRQIGIALLQYMEDYKRGDWETEVDSYAGIEDPLERRQLVARWGFPEDPYQLYEGGYLKDRRLLQCPANRHDFLDVHYAYNNPALLPRVPPYVFARVNTWEDSLWVLRQRKWEYPIMSDMNHNNWAAISSRDDKILRLTLRLNGRVDRRIVTLSDWANPASRETL